MKISACIIAKNEEENIGDCLESLQSIVDELIVVDTGSTDQTQRIAKSFHAQIYHYPWQDDFSAAKNFALEKASGDWIIFLDADEYFSIETIGNVRAVINRHAKECDGYLIKMINIDVDQGNKKMDDFYCVRIFKNTKKLRFFNKVHEELRFVDGRRKALYQVDEKEILLYHTGYSAGRMKIKCQRDLILLLRELEKEPNNVDLYRYLADVYYGLKDYENAIKYAKLDIETGRKEISYASRSYRILNNSLIQRNAPKEEIEKCLLRSIEAFPALPDFYVDYALLKYNHKEYDEAFSLLIKAMDLHKDYHDMETSLFSIKRPITYLLFGLLYEHKDDLTKAIEFYQNTLDLDRYYPEAFVALFRLIGEQEEAYVIAFLNTIYDVQRQTDLEFLVQNIGSIGRGKIYYYYFNKLESKRKENSGKSYSKHALRQIMFLTLSIILMHDVKKLQQVEKLLPSSYKNIAYQYLELCDEKYTEIDFAVYKNILMKLLLTGELKAITKYLMISKVFDQRKIIDVATILQNKRYFAEALTLYEFILSIWPDCDLAYVYYQAGICAYQIDDASKRVIYFEQSLKCGCKEKDLKEFLAWSVEK